MAHDILMSGHLGWKKSIDTVLQHYFCPGTFSDGAKYCKSCPDCHKGKAKGIVRKVPLVSVTTIDVPFKRIDIAFVGALPLTDSKNRYVLVYVDYLTRYLEEVALKNLETETVLRR